MTTVIRASNISFNNKELPVLNRFVTDGLVGAYRFNDSQDVLKDLSGNGNDLSVVGSPQLMENYVVGGSEDGFATPIKETRSITLTAVYKVDGGGPDGEDYRALVVGNHNSLRGTAIWSDDTGELVLTHVYSDITNENVLRRTQIAEKNSGFKFIALTVNATDNTAIAYNLTEGVVNNVEIGGGSLANRLINTGDNINILAQHILKSWSGKTSVAEVLIYDKALTSLDLQRQYNYSKEFMQKNHSITI